MPWILSGMIGSSIGWTDSGYLKCPVKLNNILKGVKRLNLIDGNQAFFVPGLSCDRSNELCDVLKGEEAQILGVLALEKMETCYICLPGTHSKWAYIRDNVCETFSTYMTGELFELLSKYSTLRSKLSQTFHESIFEKGIDVGKGFSLSNGIFYTRSLLVQNKIEDCHVDCFLSSILIGN